MKCQTLFSGVEMVVKPKIYKSHSTESLLYILVLFSQVSNFVHVCQFMQIR